MIDSDLAPTTYDYSFSAGVLPVLQSDGSVLLIASFDIPEMPGEQISFEAGRIDAPWAVDALGDPVPTHYEVHGSALRQVVDLSATKHYPVVADPTYWWGWNAFIPNSVHQKVFKLMAVGAAAATIANLFVVYIPNAYVQLAVRLAAAMALAGTALWNACNLNGRGVIIGQSWLAGAIPPMLGTAFIRSGFFCLPQ